MEFDIMEAENNNMSSDNQDDAGTDNEGSSRV